MKEDRLTNALIKGYKQSTIESVKVEKQIIPEAHYNHYGTRGVADLYVHTEYLSDHSTSESIYEVKANPENANEVVRQFNKMRKYFHKGSNRIKADQVIFHLVFTAEPSNVGHVIDNKEIYRSIADKENTFLSFRHPNNTRAVTIFPGEDYEIGTQNWRKHVKAVGHEENLDTEEVRKLVEVV